VVALGLEAMQLSVWNDRPGVVEASPAHVGPEFFNGAHSAAPFWFRSKAASTDGQWNKMRLPETLTKGIFSSFRHVASVRRLIGTRAKNSSVVMNPGSWPGRLVNMIFFMQPVSHTGNIWFFLKTHQQRGFSACSFPSSAVALD
jgi:hypothetical protein